jgi:glycosyltransferase involved in cell wall biosynthesis
MQTSDPLMSTPYRLAVLNSHPIQYFAPLYRRLAQEPAIDLTVYYCSRQGVETYLDAGFGIPVQWDIPLLTGYRSKFLPNLRRSDRVGGFLSLVNPALLHELRENRYDALWVHGHNYFTFVLAILAARLFRTPILMRGETHLLLARPTVKRALRQPLMRLLYRHFCAACLPIGSRNREFYRAHGVPDERLFLVPYAVDNAYFMGRAAEARSRRSTARRDLGLPIDKILVLFASKLTPRKRPMDLLSAFHRLQSERTDAALTFAGSGESEETLRGYVEQHQVSDVYFLGFRNQRELPTVYAVADVFALPSENEPWGLAVNEAMCAGLPILASREIGAAPDLVKDGYNGFTFRAGDVEDLTLRLRPLISDSALRRQMGEHSTTLIGEWDFERCVQGVLAALESLRKPGEEQ